MNEIDKRIEYAKRRVVRLRNYQRARQRALSRLRQMYPDQYRELLEEERARDEAEGKKWLDIYGRTSVRASADGHTTLESTGDQTQQARHNGATEGELG